MRVERVGLYGLTVPKLWTDTVETHRQEVRESIVEATGALVLEHGLLGVTMSQIAEATGIGRATLYKYFPDVQAILVAWHERHVAAHLTELGALSHGAGTAADRLRSVLVAYARICRRRRQHGEGELLAALHRTEPVLRRQRELLDLVAHLIDEAAAEGRIRDDIDPRELAHYCTNALEAAASVPSKAALTRLLDVVWAGMAAPGTGGSR
jgi:AcrR family transcriptional regulator